MKINPKKGRELTMEKNENPVDFFRRVRKAIWERFDNKLHQVCQEMMKYQEQCKDRLVDVSELRKKGLIK